MKVNVDKTLVASIALHVLVIGWGLVSFSTKAFSRCRKSRCRSTSSPPTSSRKVTAGMKTGKKEDPKPMVEKVAEAKPVDDAVGKITEKKPPVVTDTAPPPPPKVEEKPVEKKPDPPKPVAEKKPKEEPKPIEKKPDPPKVDPIAEALKKEEQEAAAEAAGRRRAKPPEQPKPKERTFDQSKIAALLDKRDPSRQAVTGDDAELATLRSALAKGTAADNSATWGSMFQAAVERCWKPTYGGHDAEQYEADIDIRHEDRRLAGSRSRSSSRYEDRRGRSPQARWRRAPSAPSCSVRPIRSCRSSNIDELEGLIPMYVSA